MSAPPADCERRRTGFSTGRTRCASSRCRVLGAVVRRFGDFSKAEDAVQEALLGGGRAVAG